MTLASAPSMLAMPNEVVVPNWVPFLVTPSAPSR